MFNNGQLVQLDELRLFTYEELGAGSLVVTPANNHPGALGMIVTIANEKYMLYLEGADAFRVEAQRPLPPATRVLAVPPGSCRVALGARPIGYHFIPTEGNDGLGHLVIRPDGPYLTTEVKLGDHREDFRLLNLAVAACETRTAAIDPYDLAFPKGAWQLVYGDGDDAIALFG